MPNLYREECRKVSCALSASEGKAWAPWEDKQVFQRYDISIIPLQDMSRSVNLIAKGFAWWGSKCWEKFAARHKLSGSSCSQAVSPVHLIICRWCSSGLFTRLAGLAVPPQPPPSLPPASLSVRCVHPPSPADSTACFSLMPRPSALSTTRPLMKMLISYSITLLPK